MSTREPKEAPQPPASTLVGAIDKGFWRDRHVLVTGHTGFKGGWLALWLQAMGSAVHGLSCGIPTEPSLYCSGRVGEGMADEITADVRDFEAVARAFARSRPEIVIHMAAQPLVRRSFVDPRTTFETNVLGTVNVLDAVRTADRVRAVVIVTSDKCYENRGWEWAYRESEPMGGHDPYSSSKGAAELVTAAYRRSFFSTAEGTRLGSARSGNVIGGGDWAAERLVPDAVRAMLDGTTLRIRNPGAVRPWQHVLNPLSGYLMLAQALWSSQDFATGWNFGPPDEEVRPVSWVVESLRERWSGRPNWEHDSRPHPPEAGYLKLDSSRARNRLGWRPLVSLETALDRIADWYDALLGGADMRAVTLGQIDELGRAATSPDGTTTLRELAPDGRQ
jgi:CDP-glucose 4,6-dehydratase